MLCRIILENRRSEMSGSPKGSVLLIDEWVQKPQPVSFCLLWLQDPGKQQWEAKPLVPLSFSNENSMTFQQWLLSNL